MTAEEYSKRLLLVAALLAGEFYARRAFCRRDAIGRAAFAASRLDAGIALVSRIRRSASSRIDCFDIRSHLCWPPKPSYSTGIARTRKNALEPRTAAWTPHSLRNPTSTRHLPGFATSEGPCRSDPGRETWYC
jgi:hypothetical protein